MLADAEKTPNVVKCCNKDGLYDQLEDIQARSVPLPLIEVIQLHVCVDICVAWWAGIPL